MPYNPPLPTIVFNILRQKLQKAQAKIRTINSLTFASFLF